MLRNASEWFRNGHIDVSKFKIDTFDPEVSLVSILKIKSVENWDPGVSRYQN